MKKGILLFTVLLSSVFGLQIMAQDFGGGSGTANDPYIISNVTHLNNIRNINWDVAVGNKPHFRLESDIDLAGMDWVPINNKSPYAHLHIDGNGHVIKNMKINPTTYASFFGVICGSCKNLGFINAEVVSNNGGGIITGYVGTKTPDNANYTAVIENCYTTGKITAPTAVGGIAGNIGMPAGGVVSAVRNCYSTVDVTATNDNENARAGGIAGNVYKGGVIENCYSTGTITATGSSAGGIVSYTESTVNSCVALNSQVKNIGSGNIGRIAAIMAKIDNVQAQGNNCWGYNGVEVKNGGAVKSESQMVQGEVTAENSPYDGVSKTKAYLEDPANYFNELKWDKNIWAEKMSNGKPIFKWLYKREDYAQISGHLTTSVNDISFKPAMVTIQNGILKIRSERQINSVMVYNTAGQAIYSNRLMNTNEFSVNINHNGIIIVSVLSEGYWNSYKILNKLF